MKKWAVIYGNEVMDESNYYFLACLSAMFCGGYVVRL